MCFKQKDIQCIKEKEKSPDPCPQTSSNPSNHCDLLLCRHSFELESHSVPEQQKASTLVSVVSVILCKT